MIVYTFQEFGKEKWSDAAVHLDMEICSSSRRRRSIQDGKRKRGGEF